MEDNIILRLIVRRLRYLQAQTVLSDQRRVWQASTVEPAFILKAVYVTVNCKIKEKNVILA